MSATALSSALARVVPAHRRRAVLGTVAVVAVLGLSVPLGRVVLDGTAASSSGSSSGSTAATAGRAVAPAAPEAGSVGVDATAGKGSSAAGSAGAATDLPVVGPVLARSAWLGVKVPDLVAASDRARAVTAEVRGTVLFENVVTATDPTGRYGSAGVPDPATTSSSVGAPEGTTPVAPEPVGVDEARLTLSVPAATLDRVLASLSRLGTVSYRSSQSEDVTASVVDARARVQPARDGIARVRALLAKATDLQQVVTLEGELSRRQADLDSLTARLAELDRRTTTSEVTVTLWTAATEPAATPDTGIGSRLRGAWDGLLASLTVVLTGLAVLLPWIVIGALAVVVTVRVRRRRAARSAHPAGTPRPAD